MHSRSYVKKHKGHGHYVSASEVVGLRKEFNLVEQSEKFISAAKALTDPTKLKIFLLLNKLQEVSVNDIASVARVSQSATSHALSDLKKLGLVKSHRCGQVVCYSVVKSKDNEKLAEYASSMLT